MKKIIILSGFATLAIFTTTMFYSCKKQNVKTEPIKTTNMNATLPANEITFKPKDKTEAGKLAIAFLKTTNYCPNNKTVRTDPPNLDPMLAAWDIEACANFLENSNVTKPTTHTIYTITLQKDANGDVIGSDLATKFNTLIATLNGQTNIIPKLINVTISENVATAMHLQVDVNYGVSPDVNVIFPTAGMNYKPAATWLSINLSTQLQEFCTPQPPGAMCACEGIGFFYYNIATPPTASYNFPITTDLPDPWMWTAYVANSNSQDQNFKVTDFPVYYNKAITYANNFNANASNFGAKIINISFAGTKVTYPDIDLGFGNAGNLGCVTSSPLLIDGYQQVSFITTAFTGCMPYPY